MIWSRRTPEPVRLAPRHRRDWRRLWRYCRCGFRWRCPDALVPAPALPFPPRDSRPPNGPGRQPGPVPPTAPAQPGPVPPTAPAQPGPVPPTAPAGATRGDAPRSTRPMNRGHWTAPTGSHLIGRAGRLTPAQADRAGDRDRTRDGARDRDREQARDGARDRDREQAMERDRERARERDRS